MLELAQGEATEEIEQDPFIDQIFGPVPQNGSFVEQVPAPDLLLIFLKGPLANYDFSLRELHRIRNGNILYKEMMASKVQAYEEVFFALGLKDRCRQIRDSIKNHLNCHQPID